MELHIQSLTRASEERIFLCDLAPGHGTSGTVLVDNQPSIEYRKSAAAKERQGKRRAKGNAGKTLRQAESVAKAGFLTALRAKHSSPPDHHAHRVDKVRRAKNAATRWDTFYASGSRHAPAIQSEWGRFQRARNGAITAAGLATLPTKTVLDASASALGYKAEKSKGPSSMRSGRTGCWRSTLARVNSRATTRGAEPFSERRRARSRSSSSPARRCDTAASPHRSTTLQSRTNSGYRRAV